MSQRCSGSSKGTFASSEVNRPSPSLRKSFVLWVRFFLREIFKSLINRTRMAQLINRTAVCRAVLSSPLPHPQLLFHGEVKSPSLRIIIHNLLS